MALKNALFYLVLMTLFLACGTGDSTTNNESINVDELFAPNSNEEPIELNAYFKTKLENLITEVKENKSRLTSLESRIEELKNKSSKSNSEPVSTEFESEWTDIFNGNNEIENLTFSAQDSGNERLLNTAQEKLGEINSKIDLLDLELFKSGTSSGKSITNADSKEVPINNEPTKEEKQKDAPIKSIRSEGKPIVESKPTNQEVISVGVVSNNTYDASLASIVSEDCNRLSRKLTNITNALKKLITGKNVEYASLFSQETGAVKELIQQLNTDVSTVESVIAKANQTKSTDQLFAAKQKTQGLSKKITEAESIVLKIAQRVDTENRKKANREEEEKRQKALALENEAKEQSASSNQNNGGVVTNKEPLITEAELDAISMETINLLMELSPENRSQSISTNLESRFADPKEESVFLFGEYNKVKKYSIRDYIRKMIISGPYFIRIRHIEMNKDRKITRIDLQDTKVQ